MATKFFPNGLGESLGGDVLATQKPLLVSGNVWWVNSVTGTDDAGTAGQDREKPLATLGQANTNAADNDIIVLQSGHTETLTAAISLKAVTVVGIGTTSGKPAAQLKIDAASAGLLNFSLVSYGELRNIYFPAAVQSNSFANGKIRFTTAGLGVVSGCYFESSANDQLSAVTIDTGPVIVENSTFVSTATSTATRPTRGLRVSGATSNIQVVGCVFDDGTVGYSTAACDLSGGAITRLRAHSNSLLRGAQVIHNASTTGYFIASTQTGGARIDW